MEKVSSRRHNKKHFIIYNNNGVISATTPKGWARAHQELFPKFDFETSMRTPKTVEIERYLVEKLGYRKVENSEIIVCYHYTQL